ncbi:MAG: hypothetical protein ACMUIP_16650 [bacterium]
MSMKILEQRGYQALAALLAGADSDLGTDETTQVLYDIWQKVKSGRSDERIKIFQDEIDKLPDGAYVMEHVFKCDPHKEYGEENADSNNHADNWPKAPDEAAYYGLAGDVVKTISPYSESDDVALLTNTLIVFGTIIGRGPFFMAGSDKHHLNLFCINVGRSGKARKGMSWGFIKSLFTHVDDNWAREKTPSGLATGEGLIYAVRDEVITQEPIKVKGEIQGYQDKIEDKGIDDKRILVIEPEFVSALKVITRQGNILSPIIRQAFDTGCLRTLTRNSPLKATDAHISIIGHITKDELLAALSSIEMVNGFGNRFLWVCVRRSKYLPEGPVVPEYEMNTLVEKMKESILFSSGVKEMRRDEAANRFWFDIYSSLSEGKIGLYGALIARGEALVMRLACIYALLNRSSVIRKEHIEAALALWKYCEASAFYIFGNKTGNPIADTIYRELHAGPLTRTDICGLFSHHTTKNAIDSALELLESQKKITIKEQNTQGRPRVIITLME